MKTKMYKITPSKDQDGKETVTLFGKTLDVTGKDSFTLFKRDYKVVRAKKSKKTSNKSAKAEQADTEAVESQE